MGVLVCCLVVVALIRQSHSSADADSPLHRFKRYQEDTRSDSSNSCYRPSPPPVLRSNFSLDVRMPGVTPTVSDTYLCVAVPVPTSRDAYIVDFVPHASMTTAHHMLLYGCQMPVSTTGFWDCGSTQGTCKDGGAIMYAWARNAPPTKLPRDVGFRVGSSSRISYFVLQIHYGDVTAFKDHHKDCSGITLKMTSKPQPFIAGMYLMMSTTTIIPPGNRVTNADIACEYASYPIYPFAFRTHTHHLGQVVSGYRIRDGKWTLIGRQSPQLPQAFYAANKGVEIQYGDTVAARCVFTGEGRTSKTYIGGTSSDEMCNFYIMYYMDSRHAVNFQECMNDGPPELFRHIPAEANTPIPVSPAMMDMMHSAHHTDHQDDRTVLVEPKRAEEVVLDQGYHLEEVLDWPVTPLQVGQVSGLALDSAGNLVVFHRGDHQWGADSFDFQQRYKQRSLGAIQQSTILVLDPLTGSVLKASGRNMFYLPHGITTDAEDNYWVTDVALHQVFKVGSAGGDKPLLVLGEAFQPGTDKEHFCKPTDVAVDTVTGNIYISDGYCNARVLKFSPQGKYLSHWGAGSSDRRRRQPFRIPHSLAFLADKQELCVADRENGRIQCFVAETGEFIKEIKKDEFGGSVYAIAYTPAHGGLIYAVNGEPTPSGFMINYTSKAILDSFSPDSQEFQMPHDIVVNKDGVVFVGDAKSDSVVKFSSEKAEHRSVKKGGIEVEEVEETETFINLKPLHTVAIYKAVSTHQKPPETAPKASQQSLVQPQKVEEKEKVKALAKQSAQGVSPAVITTLLLIPLVVVISIGVFIRWRKSRMYGDGCEVKLEPNSASGGILGKLRGKAAGGLNLGNFFASHKGYSRQGFDRLSTEGSDQEKDEEDATDSENEEYSAPPPPSSSS